MRPYAIYINQEALDIFPRTGSQRTMVMNFVRTLATNPNTVGDFSDRDTNGRSIQVKIIGRYAITFWADHAVAEVKVTHIKPADL